MNNDAKQELYFGICIIALIIFLGVVIWCFTSPAFGKEEKWSSKYITVKATAYCTCVRCCNKKIQDGKTATGTNAYKPGIAVDPKVIPFHSRIDCVEYTRKPEWCEADDCSKTKEKGGKVIGNHIDLRFESHREAKEFGVKEVKIRVWTRE